MQKNACLRKINYPVAVHRITKISLSIVVLALALSSCSKSDQANTLSELTHIHSVATDGENIYVASHHGLYLWQENQWQLQGDEFDVMGLAITGTDFYASGHPGKKHNLPDPVGVLVSKDQGQTWTPVSLTGKVDFHLLEVSGENFIGVAANYDSVLKSSDYAKNWEPVQVPRFSDMTLNPDSPDELLLSGEDGLSLSKDFAQSFATVGLLQNVSKVAWITNYVYAATENALFKSKSPQDKFQEIQYTFQSILDIDAKKNIVVVLDELGVHVSYDSGNSFSLVSERD